MRKNIKGAIFESPQIANPQILELIPLTQIRIFFGGLLANHKSANFSIVPVR